MHKLTIEEMNRISVEQFRAVKKMPLVVVLDNVRSANNVGSIFRTADAFRVANILLCGITPVPPSNELHKTALGAEESVSWQYYKDTLQAVEELRKQNYLILSVEQVKDSTLLQNWKVDVSRPTALILGNEVFGVGQEVVNASDGCLEIPQFGTKHSLNVACTTSIVLWEFARQYMGLLPVPF